MRKSMRGSRKFSQRESNSDKVFLSGLFLLDEGRGAPNNTKSGSSCWQADDVPKLSAGFVAL